MAISSSNFAVIFILSVVIFLANNPLRCEAGNVLYSSVGAMYPVEFLQHNTTQLILREDCDLVMPYWQTDTSDAFCNLTLESNGELVLYGASGDRLWASDVSGSMGEYVLVLNFMKLEVYGPSKWATNTALETLSRTDLDIRAENVLSSEQTLKSGNTLKNGRWELKMLDNCTLVLCDRSEKKTVWSSNTSKGREVACHLKMESTGDLVIYDDESGDQVWSSDTSGIGSSVLVLRHDGNLVIYGPTIWETLPLLHKDRKQSALGRPFIKMV